MDHDREPEPCTAALDEGDCDSFRQLVETHSHAVFRVVYRILGDEGSAEDAVQETFLRAYRQRSSFDGRARVSTWLHRIAVNYAIDLRRQRGRRLSTTSLSDAEHAIAEPPSTAPLPDRLLASKQVGQATRAALDSLTSLERAAFTLRHFEGESIAAIGAVLGLRESATKQAIFRAVQKLRRSLEPLVRIRHEAGP